MRAALGWWVLVALGCSESAEVAAAKKALIDDVNGIAARQHHRTPHGTPLPGSVLDALAPLRVPLKSALLAYNHLPKSDVSTCDDARDLGRPLPTPCAKLLDGREGTMARALLVGLASDVGLRSLDDPGDDTVAIMANLVRLSTFSIMTLREHGAADDAAQRCVDAYAVVRDLTYGPRPIEAVALGKGLFTPCKHALVEASAEARGRLAPQLDAIAQGLARSELVTKDACTLARLSLFGGALSDAQVAQLPLAAQARAHTASPEAPLEQAKAVEGVCREGADVARLKPSQRGSPMRRLLANAAPFRGALPDFASLLDVYESLQARVETLAFASWATGKVPSELTSRGSLVVERSGTMVRAFWANHADAGVAIEFPLNELPVQPTP